MEIFLPGYSLDTLIASHQGTSIYSGFCSATNEACVIKLVMNQLSSLSELTRLTHEYSVLNRIDNVLVPKAHELIRFDGGIALLPGQEGHGGSTFCGVASLVLMDKLESSMPLLFRKNIIYWCVSRQVGGMQGRPNKLEDTCYSYWIGGTLKLLGHQHDLLDQSLLNRY